MNDTRIRRVLAAAGAVAVTTTSLVTMAGQVAHATEASTRSPHHPSPSHFTHGRVTNPYYPLKPGTVLVYRGRTGGQPSRDIVVVADRTRVIDGVRCRVVLDRLYINGVLKERTRDFFAQTKAGTVWYFGEHTAELDRHGQVTSREGSFLSGRDGAEAGIFMPAHPHVGDAYRQEDYPGHAEDRFVIRSRTAHVATPVVTSDHALRTAERSELDPGVVEHKRYVRGIGDVADRSVKGESDHQELVAIRHR